MGIALGGDATRGAGPGGGKSRSRRHHLMELATNTGTTPRKFEKVLGGDCAGRVGAGESPAQGRQGSHPGALTDDDSPHGARLNPPG